MDRLEEMIAAQHKLQCQIAVDPLSVTGPERIQYIKDMILACTDELHEALAETGWKPWSTSMHVNERAAFGELRDAWQFLTNAMLAVAQRPADEVALMLHHELLAKIKVNVTREETGYDGITGKCPACKRDVAEADTREIISLIAPIVYIHCVCGRLLGSRPV